jgi:hypothetical protein
VNTLNWFLRKTRYSAPLVWIGVVAVAAAIAQSTATLIQVVNKSTPTVTAVSSLNPSVFGSQVTFSASLTAALANQATGTVQWMDGATPIGSPVPVASAAASMPFSVLTAGTHSITAVYSGDSDFTGATSAPISQVVNKATPGVGGFAPISVASSLNPSIYQNNVTFTSTAPAGATGTISFMDATTTLGTSPLVAGSATFSIPTLIAGTHPITAVYSGDSNFNGATSAGISQVVNKAPTVESVYATPPTSVTVGSSVTFTTLVNTGALLPTGSVVFMDGATTLGTGTVASATATNLLPYSSDFTQWTSDSAGVAAPTVTAAALGPDGANSATTLTYPATTGGNHSGLKLTATGTFGSQQMAVSFWALSSSSTVLTVNLEDGAGANVQTANENTSATWQRFVVPFTMAAGAGPNAIVSIQAVNEAAGTVSIYGAQLEQAATAGVYVMTTGASAAGQGGIATYTTSSLLGGSHPVTGVYSGDSNYLGNTGALNSPLTIGQGTAAAVLASSLNPSNYGQSVTFTATLTGPNATPTGTVTFLDGATTIGTGTLDASGKATMSISSLVVGTHPITAQYGGDTNFGAVTSAPVSQVVNAVAALVGVTSSVNPSDFGQSIIFTATVTGSGATPTGTVVVTDGATSLGTITLVNGSGTLTTATLTGGSHTLLFTYSGDSNYTH